MKKITLFFACLHLIFSSCEKEIKNELKDGALNLSKIEKGQITKYIGFQSVCGEVNKFQYTGDTLILEVQEVNGELFLAEYLSEFSTNKATDPVSITAIKQINEGLQLTNRLNSKFFNFYGSDTLKLNTAMSVPMEQKHCKVTIDNEDFRGSEMGKIKQFKIGDIEIKDKTIVSCIPIIEVDGYLIYDSNQLFLNYAMYNSSFNGHITNSITGWKKI